MVMKVTIKKTFLRRTRQKSQLIMEKLKLIT